MRRKAIISVILFCFVFVFITGAALAPRPAQAQLATVEGPGPLLQAVVQREVKLTLGSAITASAVVGLVNAITLMGEHMAYDLAVGLASGCRGGRGCFWERPFGEYMTETLYTGAGEFISTLADPLQGFLNFNICQPRIPDIGLSINLGLINEVQPREPKCDFLQTINNWQNVVREVQDPHALLSHLSLAFNPGQSDIGMAFETQQAFKIKIARDQAAAEKEREEGEGTKPLLSPISRNIQTPSVVMRKNFEDITEQGKNQTIGVGDIMGATLQPGSGVWTAVGSTIAGTFVNTLLSRMLKMALQGIFGQGTAYQIPDLTQLVGGRTPTGGSSVTVGLSPSAVGLLSINVRTSDDAFDYLTDLAACPDDHKYATQFNCTIDQQFMVAIQQAKQGNPLTVAQAMDGMLDPAKPFGFVNPEQGIEPDFREGYPYSSMKKLRLLRIIPVGWEFAALKIRDVTKKSATLKDVIDGWNKTGPDGKCGTTDDKSPFCGLVDPNWVLKAPPAQCNATVFGESLDGSGTGRQEVCADLRHCVAEDSSGNCRATGYCAREKNIWVFQGDACEEQYAGCDTFRNENDPRAQTSEISLLANTNDFGACSAANAGCAGYFTQQAINASEQWNWNTSSARLYLDRDAPVCDSSAKGCSEFILANKVERADGVDGAEDFYKGDTAPVYYRVPPDYLGCTGEENDEEARVKGCKDYAGICRVEEVGCESYTPVPVGVDEPIPGIVTALDTCDPRCVGYSTYIKKTSSFEPAFTRAELGNAWSEAAPEEGLYRIIPRNTAQCTEQEEGCDEFTNLRTEQRAYYSDLRACQVPGTDSQTYFTWEGSGQTGYQLKSWTLKTSNRSYTVDQPILGIEHNKETATPPCTNYSVEIDPSTQATTVRCIDNDATTIEETNQAVCDLNDSDPAQRADCRAFYDKDGNIFYRLMSRTIVSTAECQTFRWTGLPQLPEIGGIEGESQGALRKRLEETACTAKHGFWNSNAAQCIYLAVPSQSSACRAQSAGCRGFKGNTASALAIVFNDVFPAGASLAAQWSVSDGGRIDISSESLRVGDKSLRGRDIVSNGYIKRELAELTPVTDPPAQPPPPLPFGVAYFANFLIKGSASQNVEVFLGDVSFGRVNINPEWQYVELGPVVPVSSPSNIQFRNVSDDAITFYLDDLRLRYAQDMVYLVKNTWNIPLVCDQLAPAAGGGYLPGAMLGCQSYTDRAGVPQAIKSFSRLCRARSAGCTDLIDTRGSESLDEQFSNKENSGVCRRADGQAGDCALNGITVCAIAAGQTSCNYGPSYTGTASNLIVDDLTTPADRHRYIVIDPPVRPEFACSAEQKGCQALGKNAADTVYRINDPERYGSDLCQVEAEGCAVWRSSDQSASYFKDPTVGTNLCEWKTNARIGRDNYSGWFKKEKQLLDAEITSKDSCQGYGVWTNVASATGSSEVFGCVDHQGNLRASITDPFKCDYGIGGIWVGSDTNGQCFSDAPCYGSAVVNAAADRITITNAYLIGGSTFGIWRNADARYQGFAGMCPSEQATCSEFVDPTDASFDYPEGQPYYFKNNDRLKTALKECNGLVSRKQGCVLFNDTENPTQQWAAEASYASSEASGGERTAPVQIATENNTNTILKVQRDRQCSEWIQCQSGQLIWNEQDQEFKAVCAALARCNKIPLPAVKGGESTAQCGDWVVQPDPRRIGADGSDQGEERLTLAAYQQRDKSFNGPEYTGYSIPGFYPIEKLREFNTGSLSDPVYRLVYMNNRTGSGCNPGSMINGRCIDGPSGGSVFAQFAYSSACRGFPESSSPFPNVVTTRDSAVFENAPLCLTSKGETASNADIKQCGCNYLKAEYGTGLIRYYDADEDEIWPGICQNGTEHNKRCVTGAECRAGGGECNYLTRRSDAVGWQGFCLEKDVSAQSAIYNNPAQKACLTWWPVDVLQSTPDIYNQFAEAGYRIPDKGGEYWCLQGGENEIVTLLSEEKIAVNSNYEEDDITVKEFNVSGRGIMKQDIKGIGISVMEPQIKFGGGDAVPESYRNIYASAYGVGAEAGSYYLTPGSFDEDAPDDDDSELHIISPEHLSARHAHNRTSPNGYGHTAYETPLDSADPYFNKWWWGGDDDAQHTDGHGRGKVTEKGTATLSQLRDAVIAMDIPAGGVRQDVDGCGAGWDVDEKYDGQMVVFYFNNSTQLLEKIRIGFCSGDDGGEMLENTDDETRIGGAELEVTSEDVEYDSVKIGVNIVINPRCSAVTRIDPLRSAPVTGKLWGGAPVLPASIVHSGEDYAYTTPLTPFGSSVSHIPPTVSGENNPWFLNANRLEKNNNVLQFAGWPYACSQPLSGENRTNIMNIDEGVCVNFTPRNSYPADTDRDDGARFRNPNREQSFDGGKCGIDFIANVERTRCDTSFSYNCNQGSIDDVSIDNAERAGVLLTSEYLRNIFYAGQTWYRGGSVRSNGTVNTRDLCAFFGGRCEPLEMRQCTVNSVFDRGDGLPITAGPEAPFRDVDSNSQDPITLQEGIDDFASLFAKSYKSYLWSEIKAVANRNAGKYNQSSDTAVNWDTRALEVNRHPPSVNSANSAPDNIINRITINNTAEGNVIGRNGFLPAIAQFYSKATNDHMPLRQITIDWDDGTVISSTGLYRNHLPNCDNQSFSSQNDISCENKPFKYNKTYFCEKNKGPNWQDGTNRTAVCPDALLQAEYGGCCVFKPAVQVRDNWGYCNGKKGGASTSPAGIYAIDTECDDFWNSGSTADQPWTPFAGYVLVAPTER